MESNIMVLYFSLSIRAAVVIPSVENYDFVWLTSVWVWLAAVKHTIVELLIEILPTEMVRLQAVTPADKGKPAWEQECSVSCSCLFQAAGFK